MRKTVFIIWMLTWWLGSGVQAAGEGGDVQVADTLEQARREPEREKGKKEGKEEVSEEADTAVVVKSRRELKRELERELVAKGAKKPHSPHRATIMAMILPGSGQIYNGQWWKVPILYGGVAADIYGITWNHARFREYRDAYIEWVHYTEALAQNPDTPYPEKPAWDKIPKNFDLRDPRFQTESMRKWFTDVLNNRKTSFKRNRDLCYIVMAAIYAINIIDATVYAHFYDFEIDDDLSLHWRPTTSYSPLGGGMVGVSLTLNF